MSALQTKIIAVLASMSPEEREQLEATMAKLEDHAAGIVENGERLVDLLDRFLGVLSKSESVEAAPSAEDLCGTCANPCSRKGNEEIQRCPQHHQKMPCCDTCANYDADVEMCAYAGPCKGGSAYASRSQAYSV